MFRGGIVGSSPSEAGDSEIGGQTSDIRGSDVRGQKGSFGFATAPAPISQLILRASALSLHACAFSSESNYVSTIEMMTQNTNAKDSGNTQREQSDCAARIWNNIGRNSWTDAKWRKYFISSQFEFTTRHCDRGVTRKREVAGATP